MNSTVEIIEKSQSVHVISVNFDNAIDIAVMMCDSGKYERAKEMDVRPTTFGKNKYVFTLKRVQS